MLFKEFQDLFDYSGVRELGDFSDLEIRLRKIQGDTATKISELLKLA